MSPATLAQAATRYHELRDELDSRARAANSDLPPFAREEATQEAHCLAWVWLLSAAEKGRIHKLTAFSIARYARLAYRSGRRFGVAANSHDAMDEGARVQHKVRVQSLDDVSHPISSALVDSRHPRPDEQVRMEHDLGLLREDSHLSSRGREVFDRLLLDHERGCGARIAEELGVSRPRISQITREELAPAMARIGYMPTGVVP